MIKKLISKLFGIKQCACPEDEPLVLQEEALVKKPEHCDGHLRFRKSCSVCQEIVK